jgi:hypothetical protein
MALRPIPPRTLFTLLTIKRLAQMPLAAGLFYNPGPVLPWGIMPDMLIMAARQASNPIIMFVFMKADNFLVHEN